MFTIGALPAPAPLSARIHHLRIGPVLLTAPIPAPAFGRRYLIQDRLGDLTEGRFLGAVTPEIGLWAKVSGSPYPPCPYEIHMASVRNIFPRQ